MDSEPRNETKPGTTPLPDFLGKEVREDPIPQLRALIEKKMEYFHNLNNKGLNC